MNKDFDVLLKHALTPTDEAGFALNQSIIAQIKEETGMEKRKKRRFSAAAAAAVAAVCVSSVTVFAAWKYLSSADVAEKIEDTKLAEAFLGDDAVVINEKQSYGGYDVMLMSIVSGKTLSEYPYCNEEASILEDRTYAVVAIERSDGEPMPDISDEDYGETRFFVSGLIGGYDPAFYNIASMNGGYSEINEDGVLYRLVECDDLEIFADHTLYLCVSDGVFYNRDAYIYEKATGDISRNEAYEGLNALFRLPVDAAKADPEKAAAYIESLGMEPDISEEKIDAEIEAPLPSEDGGPGAEIAGYALSFVGNPYEWGGESLTEGTDCSGFTKSVYEKFQVALPHSADAQRRTGTEVSAIGDAQPGDLVFYETPSHVAIYIGNGQVVHAMPQKGICVSEADFDEILMVRRVLK